MEWKGNRRYKEALKGTTEQFTAKRKEFSHHLNLDALPVSFWLTIFLKCNCFSFESEHMRLLSFLQSVGLLSFFDILRKPGPCSVGNSLSSVCFHYQSPMWLHFCSGYHYCTGKGKLLDYHFFFVVLVLSSSGSGGDVVVIYSGCNRGVGPEDNFTLPFVPTAVLWPV